VLTELGLRLWASPVKQPEKTDYLVRLPSNTAVDYRRMALASRSQAGETWLTFVTQTPRISPLSTGFWKILRKFGNR
jgi:hypothetical protein